ncbi:MAG: DUF2339 domain-containing protein [Chloroflexi bacterium]|nr:DUF2339 domain-containing protein [Chloroflexota bacterium]
MLGPNASRGATVKGALALSLLVLAAIKIYWRCWQHWDLPTYDDSSYLWMGWAYLFRGDLPSANWSPLYALWVATFVYFVEPFGLLAVYVALRVVTVVLTAGLLFVWLRRYVSDPVAWLLAAMFLMLHGILTLERSTTIHQFTLVPVLFALILADSPGRFSKGAALGVLLLLVTVRAENIVSFTIALFACLVIERRRLSEARHKKAIALSYLPLVPAAAVVLLIVLSARSPDDRAWVAFKQHFYWAYHERHPEEFEGKPLEAAEWDGWAVRHFGDADSIFEAAANNPGAIADHFTANLAGVPSHLADLLIPFDAARGVATLTRLAVGTSIVFAAGTLWQRRRAARSWLSGYWLVVVIYGGVLVTYLGAVVVLMPRYNLLLPSIPLFMVILGHAIDGLVGLFLRTASPVIDGTRVSPQTGLLIAFGFFVALSPTPFRYPPQDGCPIQATVEALDAAVGEQHHAAEYRFLALNGESQHLCHYLNMRRSAERCFVALPGNVPAGSPTIAAARGFNLRLVHIDERSIAAFSDRDDELSRFLNALVTEATAIGWEVAAENTLDGAQFWIYSLQDRPGPEFDITMPGARPAAIMWAEEYARGGEFAAARDLMTRYIEQYPGDSLGYEMRARVRLEVDGWQAAVSDYERALELSDRDNREHIYWRLGDVYFGYAHDLAAAYAAYASYLELATDPYSQVAQRFEILDALVDADGSISPRKAYRIWFSRQEGSPAPEPDTLVPVDVRWEPVEPEDELMVSPVMGWNIAFNAVLLHPEWLGMPETLATQAQIAVPAEWRGQRMVFLAHMPLWTYAEPTDGVNMVLSWPEIEPGAAHTQLIDTTQQDGSLVMIDVPQLARDTRLHVAIEPNETTVADALFLTLVGLVP